MKAAGVGRQITVCPLQDKLILINNVSKDYENGNGVAGLVFGDGLNTSSKCAAASAEPYFLTLVT